MLPCCPASGWRPAGIVARSLPWLHHQHCGTWPGPVWPLLSLYGTEHPSAELAGRLPRWWKMLRRARGLGGPGSFSWVWPARPWAGAVPEGAQEHPSVARAAHGKGISAQGMPLLAHMLPVAQVPLGPGCGPGSRKSDLHTGKGDVWESGSSTGLPHTQAHHCGGPKGNQPHVLQRSPTELGPAARRRPGVDPLFAGDWM